MAAGRPVARDIRSHEEGADSTGEKNSEATSSPQGDGRCCLHTPLRILGVDPGTAVTGYGLVERRGRQLHAIDYGCIRIPAGWPLPERYWKIFQALRHLIEKLHPAAVVLETQYMGRNPHSTITLAMARCSALLAAKQAALEVVEYSAPLVKKAVSGSGRASKEQMQYMVQRQLSLKAVPTPHDAADALALALCHHNRML